MADGGSLEKNSGLHVMDRSTIVLAALTWANVLLRVLVDIVLCPVKYGRYRRSVDQSRTKTRCVRRRVGGLRLSRGAGRRSGR
jgi:hypothetical protein